MSKEMHFPTINTKALTRSQVKSAFHWSTAIHAQSSDHCSEKRGRSTGERDRHEFTFQLPPNPIKSSNRAD
jgi:hypothetical protein